VIRHAHSNRHSTCVHVRVHPCGMGFPATMTSYAQLRPTAPHAFSLHCQHRLRLACAHMTGPSTPLTGSRSQSCIEVKIPGTEGKVRQKPREDLGRVSDPGGVRSALRPPPRKRKLSVARTKLSAFNGAKVNPAKNGYNTQIGRCVFVLTMHADNHLTRKIARNVCRHTFPIFYRPNTTSGNRNDKARCHNRRHFTLSHPFITFL